MEYATIFTRREPVNEALSILYLLASIITAMDCVRNRVAEKFPASDTI